MLAGQTTDPQLLARESEIMSSLQREQALLQELTDKLDGMARLLETAAPKQP